MSDDAHIDEPIEAGFPPPTFAVAPTGDLVFGWDLFTGERYSFVIDGIRPERDRLHALLTVRYWRDKDADRETLFTKMHWDLRSNSSTKAVITELNRHRKEVEWHKLLAAVHGQTELQAQTLPDVVFLDDEADEAVASQHLIHPLIEYQSTNAIGAQGDSTKSLCALAMCISIAEAYSLFPGCRMLDERQRQSLYIDFEEMTPDKYRWRMRQLYAGIKMKPSPHMVHYMNMNGKLLVDIAGEVDRYVREHGIEFIVVDSASKAVGGETISEPDVIQFFNAMATWRVTVLLIGHKAQEVPGTKIHKLSGNSQWRNQSRRYWEITAEAMGNDMNIVFEDHKGNNTTKAEPVAFRIQFDDDGWTYHTTSPDVISGYSATLNSMIQTYLSDNKPSSVNDIAEGLTTEDRRVSRQNVQKKLSAGLGRLYTQDTTAVGVVWSNINWNEVQAPEPVQNELPKGW